MKSVIYCGSSANGIKKFDIKTRQRILNLLDMLRVDLDLCPKDFKYMGKTVGKGVYELRVNIGKQHRIFYVMKFERAIYILHAFVKKTQKTSQHDMEIGRQRYKMLVNSFRSTK